MSGTCRSRLQGGAKRFELNHRLAWCTCQRCSCTSKNRTGKLVEAKERTERNSVLQTESWTETQRWPVLEDGGMFSVHVHLVKWPVANHPQQRFPLYSKFRNAIIKFKFFKIYFFCLKILPGVSLPWHLADLFYIFPAVCSKYLDA